jgi:hypothetical protein
MEEYVERVGDCSDFVQNVAALYSYTLEPANEYLDRMLPSREDNVTLLIHTAMLLWTSMATVWQVLTQSPVSILL